VHRADRRAADDINNLHISHNSEKLSILMGQGMIDQIGAKDNAIENNHGSILKFCIIVKVGPAAELQLTYHAITIEHSTR